MATGGQLYNFKGMSFVKEEYEKRGLSDTEFARLASKTLGYDYSIARIRSYRIALKIPTTGGKSEEVLEEDLAKARDLLERALQIIDKEDDLDDLSMQIRQFLGD